MNTFYVFRRLWTDLIYVLIFNFLSPAASQQMEIFSFPVKPNVKLLCVSFFTVLCILFNYLFEFFYEKWPKFQICSVCVLKFRLQIPLNKCLLLAPNDVIKRG